MNNSYFYRDTGYQWSRVLDSSGADGSNGTTIDSEGNIYTTGFYTGTPLIEDHSGNNIAILPVSVGQAAFITKFGFDGRYNWSRILDSAGIDNSFSCATDSQLNVYFGGTYLGTPTIRDEYGTNLITLPVSTSNAGFLVKFNRFGSFLFARILDGTAIEIIRSVACDGSNVFICGDMQAQEIPIRNESGTLIATIPVGLYVDPNFIVKFDSNGTHQWNANFDVNIGGASCYSITCDTQSNVYIAAQSSSTTNRIVGTILGVINYPSTTTGGGYLIKLSTFGPHHWTRIISPMSILSSVACDSTNNVYVTGSYSTATTVTVVDQGGTLQNTLTIPSTGNGLLMMKFNSNGNVLYTRTIDSILSESGTSVTCDPYASVYVCGFYNGTPIIKDDSGNNIAILPTSINQSAFLTKFSSNGVYQYSRIIDSSNVDSGQSIVCNRLGTVFFSGIYNGTPTIKNQSNLHIATLPASQGNAMFLSSFSPDGNYIPDNAQLLQCQIFNGLANDFVNTLRCDRRDSLYAGGFFQSGNLIITDQFSSNLGSIIQSNVSPGFISKFASNGVLLNSIVITGTIVGQSVEGLATDNNSNLYASGHYRGNGGIYRSTGVLSNTLPFTPLNSFDAFLLKFRENGSLVYGRIISSVSNNFSNCVACEPNGNVYMAGSCSNILSICNEFGTTLVTTTANTIMTLNNGYIVKHDPNGVFQWARVISSNNANITKVACDSTSNLYIAGVYNSTSTLLTQNSVSIGTLRSCQGESGFCIKLDTLGNILNIITIDSSLSDVGQSVVCDSENNLYFAGTYRSNAILYSNTSIITNISNTGANSSIFISKFTPTGSLLFTRIINDVNNNQFMRNMICDVYNNLYVCGSYIGTPVVRNVNGHILSTFPTSTTETGFVVKFNSSGAFHYSRQLDTTGFDDTRDVECDSNGNLFFCGSYLGSGTLRNQEGTLLANLPVSSNTSGYIMELATEGTVYQTYEYPSNVLTARNAIVINSEHGNGNYTYFTSSNTLPDLNLFDKTSNIWTSGNTFSTTSPFSYNGIFSVFVQEIQNVLVGEIIEFKCPLSLIPTGYSLQTQSSNISNPTTWYMLGYDENRNFTILDYRFSIPLLVSQTKLFNVYTTRAFVGYCLVIQNVFGNGGFASLVEFKVMGSYISRNVVFRNLAFSVNRDSLFLVCNINTDGLYNLSLNAQSNTFSNAIIFGTATRQQLSTGRNIENVNLEELASYHVFVSYNGTLVSPLSNNFITIPLTSPVTINFTSLTSNVDANVININSTINSNIRLLPYTLSYNTSNTFSNAIIFGTATQQELSTGRTFASTDTGNVYFVFLSYLSNIISTIIPFPLYQFSLFTFITGGTIGAIGPSLSNLRSNSTYTVQTWTQNSAYLNMESQGIQLWTVPINGVYEIVAAGAVGGNGGNIGRGAIISTTIRLNVGTILKILVGQAGATPGTDRGGSGGGGTFVTYINNVPLLVAGGGGGSSFFNNFLGTDGSLDTTNITTGLATQGGAGSTVPLYSGGGGGLNGNGGNSGGVSFINGGNGAIGGINSTIYNTPGANSFTLTSTCIVSILVIGGGGGGGGSTTSTSSAGGGGGAGGYALISATLPAGTYNFTIGSAGQGSVNTVASRSGGSSSIIIGTATFTVTGGVGGGNNGGTGGSSGQGILNGSNPLVTSFTLSTSFSGSITPSVTTGGGGGGSTSASVLSLSGGNGYIFNGTTYSRGGGGGGAGGGGGGSPNGGGTNGAGGVGATFGSGGGGGGQNIQFGANGATGAIILNIITNGGFGGGGQGGNTSINPNDNSSGGGGGYSGGNWGNGGNGGGSYDINGIGNSATRYIIPVNQQLNGYNSGHGFVRIRYMPFPDLVPYSPELFISALSTQGGASIPNTSSNNTGISTWGPFTAINNPIYFSALGPNNRPCVFFPGGTGAGRPYMTCSVPTNNASSQGKTVFAYLYDPTGSVFARFFLAGGLDVAFQGGGQTSMSFNNTFDFDGNTKVNITRNAWITLCWRGSVNGSGSIQDIFQNGTLIRTYTSTSPIVNGTWQVFGRSEFGDSFNDPYWNGLIYSLMVYNRILSNVEIVDLDNKFRTGIL